MCGSCGFRRRTSAGFQTRSRFFCVAAQYIYGCLKSAARRLRPQTDLTHQSPASKIRRSSRLHQHSCKIPAVKKQPATSTSSPSFVSLFSGCGGLDAGFIQAGFRCLRAFDIEKNAIDTHNLNLGDHGYVADLTKASKDDLLSGGRPDVIVSGSPCQGFSTAGKRDLHDPRNSLLLHGGRLAVALRPKVFLAENVAGALAGAHRTYWDQLEEMLRGVGYQTTTLRINAADLGLAQRRSRVILLAWLKQRDPQFDDLSKQPSTLETVLKGVDGLPQHEKDPLAFGSKHYLIANRIKGGQKLCNVRGGDTSVHTWEIPEVFGRTNAAERRVLEATLRLRRRDRIRDFGDADPVSVSTIRKEIGMSAAPLVKILVEKGYMKRVEGRAVDLVHTFNGKYKRLDWTNASLTVDTKFGDPRYFLHPSEHRGFTVREAARIQGFSDDFIFSGRAKDNFRMIGNAVPPPMGRYLAKTVKALLS